MLSGMKPATERAKVYFVLERSQFSNEGDVFGRIIFLDLQTIVTQMEQCLRVASATSPSLCFPMEGVERPRVQGDRKKNDPRNEVGLEIAEIHAKLTVYQ